MNWIESHAALATHPKTRRLARALGLSKAATIGHLHLLWWWAAKHAIDGDLSRFDPLDIADAAEWPGDPDEFLKALVDCGPRDSAGFLDADLVLHDWVKRTENYRSAAEDGRRGAHVKWHLSGTKPPSPECTFCVTEGLASSPARQQPVSPLVARQPVSSSAPYGPPDTETPRSDRGLDGGQVAPQCDPNSNTRPDLTRPDLTGPNHHPPSPPAAPTDPTPDDGATRGVVVDPPNGELDGTWRCQIVDMTSRPDWSPLKLTQAALDQITAGRVKGERATRYAQALADHMAHERHQRAGGGAVKDLRSLVLEHPLPRVVEVFHNAVTNSEVKKPIGWTQAILTGGTS